MTSVYVYSLASSESDFLSEFIEETFDFDETKYLKLFWMDVIRGGYHIEPIEPLDQAW